MISRLNLCLLPLFICVLWTSRAYSQTDSLEGEKWLERFSEQKQANEYLPALRSVDQAIAFFRKANVMERWIYSGRQKADLLATLNDQPFTALDYLDTCLVEISGWRQPVKMEEFDQYCRFFLTQAYIAKRYAEDFVLVKTALEKAYQIFTRELEADTGIAKFLYFQLGNERGTFRPPTFLPDRQRRG